MKYQCFFHYQRGQMQVRGFYHRLITDIVTVERRKAYVCILERHLSVWSSPHVPMCGFPLPSKTCSCLQSVPLTRYRTKSLQGRVYLWSEVGAPFNSTMGDFIPAQNRNCFTFHTFEMHRFKQISLTDI